jgi:hypothetical protein
VEYVGIDWSYRRAAWCALSDAGKIVGEGAVAADEDGLARLVIKRGTDVRAVVEMMTVQGERELGGAQGGGQLPECGGARSRCRSSNGPCPDGGPEQALPFAWLSR